MVKKLFTAFLLFAGFFIHAQDSAVISGGDATGSSGSFSYTVGQIAYQESFANEAAELQGVQHAYEVLEVLSVDEPNDSNLGFSVYPNPTEDIVNIAVDRYSGSLSYQFFSMTGQLLSDGRLSEDTTPVSLKEVAAGTYFIKVTQNGKTIKTFKIIKN